MDEPADGDRASKEAAEWYVRLSAPSVTNEMLEDFERWRANPTNARAFSKADEFLRKADALKADPDFAKELAARRSVLARRRLLPIAAATILMGAGLAYWAVAAQEVSTAKGEQRIVVLDDGSRVHLDTDSAIRTHMSSEARKVTLRRGQAFFDVAHDPSRPFVVRANAMTITALGTRFDVAKMGQEVRITLAEGAVEVRKAGAARSWRLAPNQEIIASQDAEPRVVGVNAAARTSWTAGVLTFEETPLIEAIAQINAYSPRKIVLAPEADGSRHVSGLFRTGQVDGFISAVTATLDMKAEMKEDGSIWLLERGAVSPAGYARRRLRPAPDLARDEHASP